MAEIARKKGIIWKPSTEAGVCPGRFQVAQSLGLWHSQRKRNKAWAPKDQIKNSPS